MQREEQRAQQAQRRQDEPSDDSDVEILEDETEYTCDVEGLLILRVQDSTRVAVIVRWGLAQQNLGLWWEEFPSLWRQQGGRRAIEQYWNARQRASHNWRPLARALSQALRRENITIHLE